MTPEALVERLPSAALVLLVGPAGCGKSTWAARRFAVGTILSSDAFRELVGGDAADQRATADAFRALHGVARARLRRALTTVVDATNLTEGARRSLRRLAQDDDRPVVAIAFDVSLERCLAQNPLTARSARARCGGAPPPSRDGAGAGTITSRGLCRGPLPERGGHGHPLGR